MFINIIARIVLFLGFISRIKFLPATAYLLAILLRIGAFVGMTIIPFALLVLAIFAGGDWVPVVMVFAAGVVSLFLSDGLIIMAEEFDRRANPRQAS